LASDQLEAQVAALDLTAAGLDEQRRGRGALGDRWIRLAERKPARRHDPPVSLPT
jgi:hypothetical protein